MDIYLTNMQPAVNEQTLQGYTSGNEYADDGSGAPRIYLLQPLSPMLVDPNTPGFNPEAKPGMYAIRIEGTFHVLGPVMVAVNLFCHTRYEVWHMRESGQGLIGSYITEAQARAAQAQFNTAEEVMIVHEHVLLPLVQGQQFEPALFSMKRTAATPSRNWNNALRSHPLRYSAAWQLTSEVKTNNKGTFFVPLVNLDPVGWVPESNYPELSAAAKLFVDAEKSLIENGQVQTVLPAAQQVPALPATGPAPTVQATVVSAQPAPVQQPAPAQTVIPAPAQIQPAGIPAPAAVNAPVSEDNLPF